jgi:hypothetical protein
MLPIRIGTLEEIINSHIYNYSVSVCPYSVSYSYSKGSVLLCALLQMFCGVLKIEAYSEMPTDRGRMDMVIYMPDVTYLFEFKPN